MNELIFFISLIVLTIMHVIGDFKTPYRTLDRTSWKTILLSEYVLVLNPLHGLWDAYSPWRKHPKYLQPMDVMSRGRAEQLFGINDFPQDYSGIFRLGQIPIEEWNDIHKPSYFAQNYTNWRITSNKFWFWLGVDQAFHMLSNVFLAWLLAVIL